MCGLHLYSTMPTHSLLPFVDSPDGLAQDILISDNANIPGPVSSMTPHSIYSEKPVSCEDSQLISCMFCDQTFPHQDELGPHVLAQHPTTFSEPTVLRVEAEFRIPGERLRPKTILPVEKDEIFSCIVCCQVSQDANELENHMRKHKDYFYYCCNICGRRFREPWFLKTHMKIHTKSGAKGKATQELDPPVTINGIAQDPASQPVVTLYKMCMVCGFFFPDHDTLAEHSKVHNREAENDKENINATEVKKELFIQGLNLRPSSEETKMEPVRSSKWIAQLDPFNTYQAWQLATKGKIAVGPNTAKDIGQEASTDNDDCPSDKEELNNIFAEAEKAVKDVRPAPPITNPQPQRRSLIQKDKSKERPTTCEECQRTFRTYHQLVLHSRIHKRDRAGADSPTSSVEGKLSRAGSLDHGEDEEGFEEAALTENMGTGEDGFDKVKGRSKECSYCGKSFRSSYYLTVHLRTHTGEKPYKCVYCDYAAAQKTSLKYHLERRHKDKPYPEIPVRPGPTLPSPPDLKHETDTENSSSPTKLWMDTPTPYGTSKYDIIDDKITKPLIQMNSEFGKLMTEEDIKLPVPVNLKMEKQEIKDETEEAPLNLSLKVSLSITSEPRKALIPSACSQCAFKTVYPEVLVIHRKLTHKDKSDSVRRPRFGPQKRHTGCPPALDGKDVTPLPMILRSHPRRTKSPNSHQEEKTEKNIPTKPTKRSPVRDEKKWQTNQDSTRYTEVMRKTSNGGKYVLDRPTPPERVGIGERSYPVRSGVIWPTDTARMCLSSRFGSLPQMDFAEPSNKRLKFRDAEESRLLVSGRSALQGAGAAVSDSLGTVGGALDSDWGMMNLLRCTTNDLASLYHTPPSPSVTGLGGQRTGGRTVLYQHLPALPNMQRREATGSFPNQRFGTSDKST